MGFEIDYDYLYICPKCGFVGFIEKCEAEISYEAKVDEGEVIYREISRDIYECEVSRTCPSCGFSLIIRVEVDSEIAKKVIEEERDKRLELLVKEVIKSNNKELIEELKEQLHFLTTFKYLVDKELKSKLLTYVLALT